MTLREKGKFSEDLKHFRKEFQIVRIQSELAHFEKLDDQLPPLISNDKSSHLNATKSARLASLKKYLNFIKEAKRRKQKQHEDEKKKELKQAFLNKQVSFNLLANTNHVEQKRRTKIAIYILSLIVLVLIVFSIIDFRLVGRMIRRAAKKNETSFRQSFR